jgi:glycosyltransferase involved in cell wall biosynthesis
MKIIYFCITKLYSGAEIYTMNLAKAFKDRGFEVVIVCPPNSLVSKKSREIGLEVLEENFGSKLSRATSLKFLLNLKKHTRLLENVLQENARADLVIFQFKGEQVLYSLINHRRWKFKVLAIEHGPVPSIFRLFPFRKLLANFYIKCEKVFTVSSVAADSLKIFSTEAHVLPPAANSNLLRIRSLWPEETSVLFAGRITKKKGIEEFVQIAIQNPKTLFYVAGAGNLTGWVEKQAEIHINLIFVGVVEDISAVLARSMAVVILSRESGEGRPLIALEAIQAGRHVFVSERCNVAELLKFEFPENVTIFKNDDINIFEEKLTKFTATRLGISLTELPKWETVSNVIVPEKT